MAEKRDPLGNGRDLLLAVVVGIFGILVIVLGFVKISSDIGAPFDKEQLDPDFEILTLAEQRAQENADKANQDTDEDGLNDFEEEFIYGTSAFLRDTDSDGFSDKEEIDNGEDPLCPRGQDCLTFVEGEEDPASGAAPAELTSEQVRQLILDQTDITEESLANFTDEDLMVLYNETIAEVGNPFIKTSTGPDTVNPDFEDLALPDGQPLPGTDLVITSVDQVQNLTPAEVRSYLLSLGAKEEDLAEFSDEDLKDALLILIEDTYGVNVTNPEGTTGTNTNTSTNSNINTNSSTNTTNSNSGSN